MPPKAASTTSKDDGAKRLKDLELLLTCVMSNTNTIEVDYDEFMKKDDAPTRPAALKRVERMSKALGVTVKAAPKKAASGDGEAKTKLEPKKNAGGKKKAAEGSEGDGDDGQSPSKKQKLEGDSDNIMDGAEE